MNDRALEIVAGALDKLNIEIPSWGFANTGTRFGKFIQATAATTIEEKFSDAAQVNAMTGASKTLALHVQWDLPHGMKDIHEIERLANKF
jgi:L-rhamnose isomerase / sugar isomerase